MTKCLNCNAEIEEGRYCNEECKVAHFNNVMLLYQPELTGLEDSDDSAVINAQSRVGLTRLITGKTPQEIMARCELFTMIATELRVMTVTDVARTRIAEQTRKDTETKIKTRQQVSERDTNLVLKTAEQRIKDGARRDAKRAGEKLSKDDKCMWCKSPSQKKFCSPECKQRGESYETWRKLPNMTDELAREMVSKLNLTHKSN